MDCYWVGAVPNLNPKEITHARPLLRCLRQADLSTVSSFWCIHDPWAVSCSASKSGPQMPGEVQQGT